MSSHTGIVGSNLNEGMRLFCVLVGSGLATGWSPVQGVLPTVLELRDWSETKLFTYTLCSKVGVTGKRERDRHELVKVTRKHHLIMGRKWCMSRSQWLRGLRHELSSLARTLGSWVRIPLKAWLSVCVYSVCVVLRVGSGLATGWYPVQGALPTL
jgi:hypothetical protein